VKEIVGVKLSVLTLQVVPKLNTLYRLYLLLTLYFILWRHWLSSTYQGEGMLYIEWSHSIHILNW